MRTVSIVIPALNERENMQAVMEAIPVAELGVKGWDVEVLVVDNGSTDGTGVVLRELGARVLVQPVRGYGNAYKAGFANSTGHVIATGDADCTYPFDALAELLEYFVDNNIDFNDKPSRQSQFPSDETVTRLRQPRPQCDQQDSV